MVRSLVKVWPFLIDALYSIRMPVIADNLCLLNSEPRNVCVRRKPGVRERVRDNKRQRTKLDPRLVATA